MTTPNFREIVLLSAYLDGELPLDQAARLDSRLASDPSLGAVLGDLRLSRTMLRRIPRRRAPRNFTLTPKMAGIKAPTPRLVPAFSWASAVALLLFVCTLGTSLLRGFSFGTSAPMMAAAPPGEGGGGAEGYGGMGGGPSEDSTAVTEEMPVLESSGMGTPTPEAMTVMVPEPNTADGERSMSTSEGPSTKENGRPNIWPYIWLGLAVLLILTALLIRWGNQRTFKRRVGKQ